MEENNGHGQENEPNRQPSAIRFIKLKPFSFVMLVFGLVLATAAVTFFVLTTGDEKVVEVVSPQKQTEKTGKNSKNCIMLMMK